MSTENFYRLGLDLGTSSIGVAVYRTDKEGEILSLEHLDSYIFGEPVEPKEMVTLNTARRSARLIRRQTERKAARLKKIGYIAQSLGVTRNDSINDKSDVIELRALAVEKKISLPQMIKVFCHIVKNRGYKGTISDGKVDKKLKKTEALLTGSKTLGQLLWEEKQQKNPSKQPWRKIEEDGTFIYRSMVEEEFERIWQEQLKYHPQLRGNYGVWGKNMFPDYPNQKEISLHDAFRSAMFYQRPIKWELDTVGNCPIFSDEKRASCAQIPYQHYRLAKEIINLRYVLPHSRELYSLTSTQQEDLFNYIDSNVQEYTKANQRISFEKIYKQLGLPTGARFTNHRGSKTGLKGNTTLSAFEQAGLLNEWAELNDKVQELVVEFLSNITTMSDIADNTPEYIRKKFLDDSNKKDRSLVANIPATVQERSQAADFVILMRSKHQHTPFLEGFKLEGGRSSYSVKGLDLLKKAAFLGEFTASNEEQFVEKLVSKNKVYTGKLRTVKQILDQESINDPVISRALTEFHRVMTYIIHKFGNPKEIVIELSRDMKNSLGHRQELEKQNEDRSKERLEAIKFLQERNIFVSSKSIERYLLWKEQNEYCPYSGEKISVAHAFDEKSTQIDHIIPQRGEISGPNVFENKVLVFTDENKEKSNRLPYEWKFKEDIDSYLSYKNERKAKRKKGEDVEVDFGQQSPLINFVRRLESLAYNKPNHDWSMRDNRFTHKGKLMLRKINNLLITPAELNNDFSNRQGQETAWIGKIVLDWCKDICQKGVVASQGALTAHLRGELRFDKILPLIRIQENKPLYDKDNKEIPTKQWEELFDEKGLHFKEADSLREDFEKYLSDLPQYPLIDTDKQEEFKAFCALKRSLLQFNKRCDHRHHAVDAAVIGLCSRSMVQRANTHHAKYGTLNLIKGYDLNGNRVREKDISAFEIGNIPLYVQLREEVQKRLTNYVVWHKPDHFPSGKFFDETAYKVEKKDGVERFVKRAKLSSFIKANEKKTLENLEKLLFTDTIKEVIITQFKERLAKGLSQEEALCGKKEDPQDGIYYRGNKVKRVKYMYLVGRGIREFDENADKKIKDRKGKEYKAYQNAGYACMDFDEKTGKRVNLIPFWKYEKNKQVPLGVTRIFIGDMLFNKEEKKFYKVKQFNAQAGLVMQLSTECQSGEARTSNLKNYAVVSMRNDISKLKNK